jgi:hypothetical protein
MFIEFNVDFFLYCVTQKEEGCLQFEKTAPVIDTTF